MKSDLELDHARAAQTIVGESWEISVGPEFPSRLVAGPTLAEAIAAAPEAMVGAEAEHGSTALLVKLLDTAQDLSLQIHPSDDYPALAPDQGGKPESWYVIARDDGAGLFLGLRENVTPERMREALRRQDDVSDLLHFVPVEPGDCFVIEPGTAHSVGAGITLLEPQRVLPNRRGVTYRYWDWDRRYNAEGKLDPKGKLRPLHVEDALAVTDWKRVRGPALLKQIRFRAGSVALDRPAAFEELIGRRAPLPSASIGLARLTGTGPLSLPVADRLRGLTVLDGTLQLGTGPDATLVPKGQSAVLPAAIPAMGLALDRAHALLSWVT